MFHIPFQKRFTILYIPCALSLLGFLCVIAVSAVLARRTVDQAYSSLMFSAKEQQSVFNVALKGQRRVLRTLAVGAAKEIEAGSSPKEVLRYMELPPGAFDFTNIGIVGADGKGYLSSGKTIDISHRDYFINGMLGRSSFIKVESGIVKRAPRFIIAAPLTYKQKTVGIIFGSFSNDAFKRVVCLSLLQHDTYSFIVDGAGGVLLDSDSRFFLLGRNESARALFKNNFLSLLGGSKLDDGKTLVSVKNDFASERGGIVGYSYSGHRRYAAYMPLGVNNWFLVNVVSAHSIEKGIKNTLLLIAAIIAVILLCALLLIIFIYLFNAKKNQELMEEKEQLRQSEELYRIVEGFSEAVIFEVNMQNGEIRFNRNFAEKFGYEPRLHNINEIAQFGKSLVNPEDFEQLMKIVDGIKSPDGENCVEFRLRHSTSGENWMRLEFTKILDSNKTVRRVVGRMVNVDGQKKNIAELQTKAESDSLTGLLNHRAAADRISEFLLDRESDGMCALFVIDIDYFKEINDKFGHFEGDLVLDSAAKIMKELFRASDVVGRIGGDEFIVLMKNLPAKETARAKAEALCRRVRAIRSSDGRRLGITVSAGVAFSHAGAGFEQLYKEADAALYEAKKSGRDACRLYSSEEEEAGAPN
ncbi:MAG: diguanylate cyclase [Cloacibacillus sp.]